MAHLEKYRLDENVRTATLRYVNNRGSRRDLEKALREAGATDEEIFSVNWSKNYFTQREFGE